MGMRDITKKASTLFEDTSNTEEIKKNVECIAAPPLYHPSLKIRTLAGIDKEIPRPFVKWVGGKRSLSKAISVRMPTSFNDYYEPFLGGGAIFFKLQPNRAFTSWVNKKKFKFNHNNAKKAYSHENKNRNKGIARKLL